MILVEPADQNQSQRNNSSKDHILHKLLACLRGIDSSNLLSVPRLSI